MGRPAPGAAHEVARRERGGPRRGAPGRAAPAVLHLRTIILLVASALILAGTALSANEFAATDDDLETFVDGVMADHFDRFELAGAAVTIVRNGDVVLSKGYGHADLATGAPVDPRGTIFSTASVAKLFTWTAVMQLVERGEIDLDSDVNTYLSALQIPATFDEPIRVRHLLSHTAGLEDTPVVGLVARLGDDVPELEAALVRWMPKRIWPPGETIAYNNYGAALAGQIVADVTGLPWEEYLESFILEPLGMTHTSPRQPLPAALKPDLATSYAHGPTGLIETPFEYTTIAPSGGMVASTHDMAPFMIAHLQNGRYGDARILEEATARRMHAQLFTHHPTLPGNAHGFWEGDANGVRYIHHRGDTSSYTKLVIVPEHDFGFYVAYNAPEGSVAREAFTTALLEHVLPVRAASLESAVTASPNSHDSLVGTYGDTRRSVTTLAKLMGLLATFAISSEDGLLVTTLPGYGQQHWVETEPLAFAEVDGPGRLAFRMGDHGRASHVTFGAFPETSFAATPPQDRIELHGALFLVWLLAALSALVAWPFFGRARFAGDRPATVWSRLVRRLPALTSLLHLTFVVILVVSLLDFAELELGVGPLLATGLTLTLLAGLLALASALYAARAWQRGTWSTFERLHYTFVALAGLALTWQLHHWNLLGIRV
jgi:CubicO group peptidase (beta-lactamase class C family)